MAGGRETPRQKMIGMMYLVLTALLAMNVSKEILNSFVVINESLYKSNEIFKDKNDLLLVDFRAAKEKDPKRFTPFYTLAQEVNKNADELNKYIEDLKKHLVMATDDKESAAADTLVEHMAGIDSKDNYDIPTHIMIGSEPSHPKAATEEWSALMLKKKIENFRDVLVSFLIGKDDVGKNIFTESTQKQLEHKIVKALELPAGVENGIKAEWEIINFNGLPLAAVITNLSKIQTDINNVQADMVGTLLSEVKKRIGAFDNLKAKVNAPSNYVLLGDNYNAEIMLVASSRTKDPKIFLGEIDTTIKDEFKNPLIGAGTELTDINGGSGQYLKKADQEGLQSWSGVIQYDSEEGQKYFPFSGSYIVAKPAASVSPDNLNVLYVGIDNPISITSAGVTNKDLVPSINGNGATIKGADGKYTIRVTGGTTATVNVNARLNGEIRNMGSTSFRIKYIPSPVSQIVTYTGSTTLKRSMIVAAKGITPKADFDFPVSYEILSYDVFAYVNGTPIAEPTTGKYFSQKQLAIINNPRVNKVSIENVRCKFPDGRIAQIPGVNVKIQ